MFRQKKIFLKSFSKTLSCVLHLPENDRPPVVIGSHGLLSTKESSKQKKLAQLCNENQIAYLRIDHTGCGESEGSLVETTIDTRINDIIAAATFLKNNGPVSNNFALFGSSMGGATCIAAWDELIANGFNMKGIVTLSAPVMGKSITEAAIANQKELNGIPISFYRENLNFNLIYKIKNIYNILIIHGEEDEIVPLINSEIIYEKSNEPKERIIFKRGDHRISDSKQFNEFILKASEWLKKCF